MSRMTTTMIRSSDIDIYDPLRGTGIGTGCA
jgi:hypothetical protein